MEQYLDLGRFPIDDLNSREGHALVESCRTELERAGMFSLDGFMRGEALGSCVAALQPTLEVTAFTHRRRHNIYFRDDITDLPPDHPAAGPVRDRQLYDLRRPDARQPAVPDL